MSTEATTQPVGEQREAAVVDNWAAVTNSFSEGAPATPEEKTPSTEQATPGTSEGKQAPIDENKGSTVDPAKVVPAATTEAKPDPKAGEKPATEAEAITKPEDIQIELKPADVKDVVTDTNVPAQGSWIEKASKENLVIKEDTYEAFKEALISPYKKEAEENKRVTLENEFAKLKPETVAAFKLLEMGVPEAQIFAPVQHLDAYIALDDISLVRAEYDARVERKELSEDAVNLRMEDLALDPTRLRAEAELIRAGLTASKNKILNDRSQLVQQYETQSKEASARLKEQEVNQIKTTLSTVEKFLDCPLPKETRDAVFNKYSKGGYDNILNSAEHKVKLMLYSEFGERIVKELRNTAFEKGRDESKKTLANIPPLKSEGGGGQVQQSQGGNWEAAEKAFGQR